MANSKLQIEVGGCIKQLRLAQGKGQTEVAQALEISVAALSKLESGLTDINLSRMAQIASYFGVPIAALLTKQVESVSAVNNNATQLIGELKQQLDERNAELMKMQKKVIDLYERFGI